MQNVLYYFIAVSVIGAVVCVYDKLAAARGWKRVPERTLFFWALVGGGPGVFACMLLIRHKSNAKKCAAPQCGQKETAEGREFPLRFR